MEVHKILQQRGSTYGDFAELAEFEQVVKDIFKSRDNWWNLKPFQRTAIEMIIHKLARIMNGNVDYKDNYVDICGYCQLVLNEIKKQEEQQNKIESDKKPQETTENQNKPKEKKIETYHPLGYLEVNQ